MKKRFLYPLVGVGALSGIAALATISQNTMYSKCNSGDDAVCQEIVRIHGTDYTYADRITNPAYKAAVEKAKAQQEALEKKKAEAAKAKADAGKTCKALHHSNW